MMEKGTSFASLGVVEVCGICDIADCHHIRDRAAKPPAEMPVAQEPVAGSRVLSFEPGYLRIAPDGSGYFCVPDAEMVFEDDRQEGPDGPEGSIHWIARMDASEIVALRDFLNGAHPPAPVEAGLVAPAILSVQRAFVFARDARPAGYEAAIQKIEALLEQALPALRALQPGGDHG